MSWRFVVIGLAAVLCCRHVGGAPTCLLGCVERCRPTLGTLRRSGAESAAGLLASQVAVFACTAFVSLQWSLWAQIYARFIWPRIGAPTALEDARPARFAQFFGFVFTGLALTFFVFGIDVAGYAAQRRTSVQTRPSPCQRGVGLG